MKLLLHCCCAPCAIMPLEKLSAAGEELVAWFYNPNIHPYQEFCRRRDTFRQYTSAQGYEAIVEDDYALEDFLREVAAAPEERCGHCYEIRLAKAAAKALSLIHI